VSDSSPNLPEPTHRGRVLRWVLAGLLGAILLNTPIYLWVVNRQGGVALGTLPERGRYYLVENRLIQMQPQRDPKDPANGTAVDRRTWIFNLYYSAASRLSFVLGLGCFLALMGDTLYRQYFRKGREGPAGQPGDSAKWFALAVLVAFFSLVAWEIGGKTVNNFRMSHLRDSLIQKGTP
jgi:hypothetical protein